MIKLFVSDIDGTLLTSQNEYKDGISNNNLIALDELQRNNVHVVLATGRHHNYLSNYIKHRDLQLDTVANNGAYVYFKNEIIYKRTFTREMIKQIINNFSEIKHKLIFSDIKARKVFFSTDDAKRFEEKEINENSHMNFGEIIPIGINEFLTSNDWLPPTQIFCHFDNQNEVSRYLGLLNKWGEGKIHMVRSDHNSIDIMRQPGCKSYGIKIIAKKLDIKDSEVAGIGDSYNDIDMLDMFAEKFCMANAEDQVKSYAKIIVNSVSEAAGIVLNMNYKERVGIR